MDKLEIDLLYSEEEVKERYAKEGKKSEWFRTTYPKFEDWAKDADNWGNGRHLTPVGYQNIINKIDEIVDWINANEEKIGTDVSIVDKMRAINESLKGE